MRRRHLGTGGPELSEIGLGSWAVGGSGPTGWGPQDDRASVEAIRRALDLGVNWIDTAPVYGWGHSEEVVADALAAGGNPVLIATKCGLVPRPDGSAQRDLNPASIRAELEASLRRLRRDRVDLYMLHWPALGEAAETDQAAWATLVDLRRQGKIGWAGVSNWSVERAELCEPIGHIDFVENPLSLVDHANQRQMLAWTRDHGVGFLAYSPMKSGLLSGSFTRARLDQRDWRQRAGWAQEPELAIHLALVERLRAVSERRNLPVGVIAIAWVLQRGGATAAIVGARSRSQIDEDLRAADVSLSDDDVQQIEAAIREHDATLLALQQWEH